MATLNTLQSFIDNAKQTPSGKVEWTDTSLKGLQDEVKLLFSQNGAQVTENTGTLSVLDNDSSQLAIVTEDATLANNGVYFWNLTPVSAINFPAGSNGYWNILEFGVTSAIAAGYIPYSNGSNFVASYLRQTTDEIKMVGGSFVANKSTSTGPYFQAGDTDSVGNNIIFTVDDKNQLISTKKSTNNVGLYADFANNVYTYGNKDTRKQLSIDTVNAVYNLADMVTSKGLRIDSATPSYKLGNYSTNVGLILADTSGYLGASTWGYNYSATTIVAGNSSVNLSLDDSQNTASVGDSTKGLFVDLINTIYTLGAATNGLVINTTGTYTLGNGTNGLDINTTTNTYKLGISTKGLNISTSSDSYKLGNTSTNVGVILNSAGGYLGSSTFGYNYLATSLVMGNASIGVTLDDPSNTAYIGTNTQGLLVDVTNSLYVLGNLSTSTGLSLGATTGYLGSSTFGYNFTATTMIAGNASVNMTLNDTTNVATLGTTSIGLRADLTNNVVTAGTTAYGFKADIPNGKIQLNGTGTYGFEMWDLIKSVYTYGASGIEGLYVDLLGHNYSLGGNNVALNISNTGKTLQTILNPSGVGTNINGLNFDYTADTYLLGGEYATKFAAIGVKGSRTATPQVQVGSDLVVAAAVGGTQLEKIRVFIPGVGVRYIPVYLS
jgi:hypothetical protein